MKKLQTHLLLSFFLFGFLITPNLTSAQLSSPSFGLGQQQTRLNLQVEPENPKPFQQVTVSAFSTAMNSGVYSISWYLDGRLQETNQNENTYGFQTGALGTESEIRAVLTTEESSKPAEQSITIVPGEVDILWEANTYTPPFYKGKALPTAQSSITLTALPRLGRTSNQSLRYTWSENFQEDFNLSGFGRKNANVTGTFSGNDLNYRVLVEDPTRNVSAAGEIELEIQNPEIIFYQRSNNQRTLYNNSFEDGTEINENEFEVVAEPYFFSFEDSINNLGRYTWRLNKNTIDLTGDKNALLLNLPDGQSGRSRLELEIAHPTNLLQDASKQTTFRF